MADWPVQHPCEKCGTRVQYRVWVATDNVALCGRCWLEAYERGSVMADRKDDRGPYTVMARHTPDGTEQRIGLHDSLDDATAHADEVVDSGLWHDANVYDRQQVNVHASVKGEKQQDQGQGDDLPPAA
jgi:formylmethanofuran dehydrogenase subunit E